MDERASPLLLKGSDRIGQWNAQIERARREILARDAVLEKRRASAKRLRSVAMALALLVGAILAYKFEPIWILAGIVAAIAAYFMVKIPAPDFIGRERVDFVGALLQQLAAIAPDARIALSAQLDARRALPKVALPGGSASAEATGENAESWLQGSLAAIPGLRLYWRAKEWRTVKLVRKRVVRRRVKIKTKTKYSIAKGLRVRLEVDRALFAANRVPAAAGRAEEGAVELRETPRGWSIRGSRNALNKTVFGGLDFVEGLDGLRVEKRAEYFGDPPAALVTLMKLCESRLVDVATGGAAR